MILGFISLLLTFGQNYIAKICVPIRVAETMLPCALKKTAKTAEEEHRRRLLWFERRFLAGATATKCKEVSINFIPLISKENAMVVLIVSNHVFRPLVLITSLHDYLKSVLHKLVIMTT